MLPEQKVKFGSLRNRLAQFEKPQTQPKPAKPKPTPSKLFPGNTDGFTSSRPARPELAKKALPDIARLISKPGPGSLLYIPVQCENFSSPITPRSSTPQKELEREEEAEIRTLSPYTSQTRITSATESESVPVGSIPEQLVKASRTEMLGAGGTSVKAAPGVSAPGRVKAITVSAVATNLVPSTTSFRGKDSFVGHFNQRYEDPAPNSVAKTSIEAEANTPGLLKNGNGPEANSKPSWSPLSPAPSAPASLADAGKYGIGSGMEGSGSDAAEADECALLVRIEAMNSKLKRDIIAAMPGAYPSITVEQDTTGVPDTQRTSSNSLPVAFYASSDPPRPNKAADILTLETSAKGDKCGVGPESVGILRELNGLQNSLGASMADAPSNLVVSQLTFAQQKGLIQDLGKRASELKTVVDHGGSRAMVDDMLSRLEKRISALERRAELAERSGEALQAELAAAAASLREANTEARL